MAAQEPNDRIEPAEEEEEESRWGLVFIIFGIVLALACLGGAALIVGPRIFGEPAPTPTPTPTGESERKPTQAPTATFTVTPSEEGEEETETPETLEATETQVPIGTAVLIPTFTPRPTMVGVLTFQVELRPLGGEVYVQRGGTGEFVLVTETIFLNEKDIVRTGRNGIASLFFTDTTEIALFENTQVQLSVARRDSEGRITGQVQQFIGKVTSRVSFPVAGSVFELETPGGIATVSGSMTSTIWFDAHLGYSPDQITNAIQSQCFFNQPYKNLDCLDVLGKNFITYGNESGTTVGTLRHFTEGIVIISPVPGERLEFIVRVLINTQGAQEDLVIEYGIGVDSTSKCGDGVCDPYIGEDNSTCPADCP